MARGGHRDRCRAKRIRAGAAKQPDASGAAVAIYGAAQGNALRWLRGFAGYLAEEISFRSPRRGNLVLSWQKGNGPILEPTPPRDYSSLAEDAPLLVQMVASPAPDESGGPAMTLECSIIETKTGRKRATWTTTVLASAPKSAEFVQRVLSKLCDIDRVPATATPLLMESPATDAFADYMGVSLFAFDAAAAAADGTQLPGSSRQQAESVIASAVSFPAEGWLRLNAIETLRRMASEVPPIADEFLPGMQALCVEFPLLPLVHEFATGRIVSGTPLRTSSATRAGSR